MPFQPDSCYFSPVGETFVAGGQRGLLGVPRSKLLNLIRNFKRVALSAASPRSQQLAVGFSLQSLTQIQNTELRKTLTFTSLMQMQKSIIALEKTNFFSKLFLDYSDAEKRKSLKEFYSFEPSFDGIKSFIGKNNYATLNRNLLFGELKTQNTELKLSDLTKENIESVKNKNTYTITTGHQLCLATGPAYFIYKIISVINLCEALNNKFPENKFVPVYWMASEDHDAEEINHVNIFSKKFVWDTKQKGRVGDFSLENINSFLDEIKQILGESEQAEKIIALLKNSYSKKTLAEATRFLVNELFGKYGLVILDGNSKALKQEFISEIKQDIFENTSYEKVTSSSEKLKQLSYDTQVTPREINVFYCDKNVRERIVKENNQYKVLNTNLTFSKQELEKLIELDTEKFSPNVVLRPVYQQKILPNAAYVGGPGELAYWLQYRAMFEEAKIPFPALIPRNFVLYVDKNLQQKILKLNLMTEDFFIEKDTLVKEFALKQQPFSLEKENETLKKLFENIRANVGKVDKTLEAATEAELQKVIKGIEALEQKGIRSIKQKNEQTINQIETIYTRLFPTNLPQERVENFLRFYLSNPNFIEDIKNNTRSFIEEKGVVILNES